jgi:hypothetical protein
MKRTSAYTHPDLYIRATSSFENSEQQCCPTFVFNIRSRRVSLTIILDIVAVTNELLVVAAFLILISYLQSSSEFTVPFCNLCLVYQDALFSPRHRHRSGSGNACILGTSAVSKQRLRVGRNLTVLSPCSAPEPDNHIPTVGGAIPDLVPAPVQPTASSETPEPSVAGPVQLGPGLALPPLNP